MRKLAAICALGLLVTGSIARADMEPVSAEQLGVAVGACVSAIDVEVSQESALTSSGWERATVSADGEAVETPLAMFGKDGNRAIIILGEAEESGGRPCVVLARLSSTQEYHPTAEGLSRVIGQPSKREEHTYFWNFDGKVAQLAPTGSREEPSLRFVVMSLEGNRE